MTSHPAPQHHATEPAPAATPSASDTAIAARVFKMAASAPPCDWHDCDSGGRIVVNTPDLRYVVIVPAGRDETGQPRPAYIQHAILPTPGGQVALFPRVPADTHTTAALRAAALRARDLPDPIVAAIVAKDRAAKP